jgi:hypothetical protein
VVGAQEKKRSKRRNRKPEREREREREISLLEERGGDKGQQQKYGVHHLFLLRMGKKSISASKSFSHHLFFREMQKCLVLERSFGTLFIVGFLLTFLS